jgi:hypothetical protein
VSRHRGVAVVASLLLVLSAACGNSGDEDDTTDTTEDGGGTGSTEAPGGGDGDRDTFVEITGVPGVTDDEIAYQVIGTEAGNPLGTCILDCFVDGVEAYFAFRNSEGGIYGRDLVINEVADDELAANQQRALDVISSDDVFGNFQATLLPLGWGDLDQAGIPTYAWGIHATDAANRPNIFPSAVIRCADCTGRSAPYLAMESGADSAAALGYGTTENSRACANANAASFELYEEDTGVALGYVNDDLEYGLSNGIGPEVTAMAEAGVDFITACMDLNAMLTIAQELERQGLGDVVLYHPNTYNIDFVREAGGLFEGDFVTTQFRPFEASGEGNALADFNEWMEAEGNDITELAMAGWVSASIAFDGLLAAGPEFDRQSVVDATNALTGYTAGGIIEPVDWADAHTPYTQDTRDVDPGGECAAIVQIVDDEFVTVEAPETPWLCWDNVDLSWTDPEPTNFE